MTQYVINIGAVPDDGTGDPLRTAFNETNLNFDQVFAAGPVLSNIQIANNKILTTNTNGNLVLAPNGTGVVQSNVSIVPNAANIRNLGSATNRWNTVYTQYLDVSANLNIAGNIVYNGDLNVDGNLTVQGNIIQVGNIVTETLTIQLANAASTANAANGSGITVGATDNIATLLYNSTGNVWTTNIGVSSVGNISAPYLFGNGSQLTGLPVQYGNANVITLLAGFGSNTVSTTGNITGGYFFGNGSQLTGLAATYGNSNVVAYGESGWAGNIIPSGNAVYSLGNATNQWNDLYVSNATIFMNNVPVSLSPGNVLTVGGNAVLQNDSNSTITTTGNITANTFFTTANLKIGINPDIVVPGDHSEIKAFGSADSLQIGWEDTAPGITDVAYIQFNDYYGGIGFITGNTQTALHGMLLDEVGNLSISGPGFQANIISADNIGLWAGNAVTITSNRLGLANTWTFDTTGNLTAPGNISATGNITGNYFFGNGSQLTGINVSTSSISNGNSNVAIATANGNVTVAVAGARTWTFDTTGNVTIPGNIVGTATIDIDNRATGNGADIQLYSADDILLQARDRSAGSTSEGGDINIFAGDSAEDSDTSAGDVEIRGGDGGAANLDYGGSGGFVTIQSGQGGAASTGVGDYGARPGGTLTLRAGDGGTNNGNIDRGAAGGTVVIEAGDSTGNGVNGGTIYLTSGAADASALAGDVVIQAGGTWTFDGDGNLNLPMGGVVYETNIPDGGLSGSAIALKPTGGTNADQELLIYPTVNDANHLHLTTGNLYNTELFLGDDNLYVKLANTGNIVVNANNNTGNSAQWMFGTDGNLTLPGNIIAINYANGNRVTGGVTFNGEAVIGTGTSNTQSGLYLAPDPVSLTNDLYLRVRGNIIDEPTHIHFDTGNNQYYNQYIGDDNKYILLANTGNIVINTNNYAGNTAQWNFGTGGTTQFPNSVILAPVGQSITMQSDQYSQLMWENANLTVAPNMAINSNFYVSQNNATLDIAKRDGSGTQVTKSWYWNADGTLTLPTAGRINFDYLSISSDANVSAFYAPAGNVQLAAGIGDAQIVANSLNDSKTWTFGNTGVLTLPGGSQIRPLGANLDISSNGGYVNLITADESSYMGVSGNGGFITSPGGTWQFDATGNLSAPGNVSAVGNIVGGNLTVGSGTITGGNVNGANFNGNVAFGTGTVGGSGNITGGNILTAGIVSATGNVSGNFFIGNGSQLTGIAASYGNANVATFLAAYGSNTISTSGNVTAGNFVGNGAALSNVTVSVAGNIVGTQSNVTLVAGAYSTVFDNTGNLTLPGNTFAVNYANNTPVDVVTRFESSWTVPVGNSTQSFTVTASNTYYMWVDCNIPNGILTWNATATVTNTNVPVVGAQYAWVYTGGGTPIDFTSIPDQFVGTSNTIVRSSVSPSATTNRFDFGINNTSAGNVTVRYGWIAIS